VVKIEKREKRKEKSVKKFKRFKEYLMFGSKKISPLLMRFDILIKM